MGSTANPVGEPWPVPLLVVAHESGDAEAVVTVLVAGRVLDPQDGFVGADGALPGTGFRVSSCPAGIVARWPLGNAKLPASSSVLVLRLAFSPVAVIEGPAWFRYERSKIGSHLIRIGTTEAIAPEAVCRALTPGISYRLYVAVRSKEFLAIEPIEATSMGAPRSST